MVLLRSQEVFLLNVIRRCFMHKPREVITVPKYIQKDKPFHEKRKAKILKKKEVYLNNRGDRKRAIITSEHIPHFNFYLNQSYSKNREVPIASLGWKNPKHKGDQIVFHPHSPNPHFARTEGVDLDFSHTGLSSTLVETLNRLNYHQPTFLQLEAIPEILKGQNVMCSGETGCGKTLAYLAPIIDKIHLHKLKHGHLKEMHPYAMIVLPSRELVYQIGTLAKQIATVCGVGVAPMIGGGPSPVKDKLAHTGYDIILTTTGLIQQHMRSVYCTDEVRSLIVDEADTILDDSFAYDLWDLMNDMKFKCAESNAGSQICLVSATIPRHIEEKLGDFVDLESFIKIQTTNVHQIQPHVKHMFQKIHKYDRPLRLLDILSQKLRGKRRAMIFTNDRKGAMWLYHFLLENNIECILLSKAVEDDERLEQLDRFNRGEVNVCVATDLGSRGIDARNVTDVINYDSPVWVADYIHRAGRTGRVGCSDDCCVTTFVCFKQAVNVINQLEYSVRTYSKIPFVDGNIKKSRRNRRNAKIDERK